MTDELREMAQNLVLSFKFRLLPTRAQHAALARILEDQRLLYNAALEERIGCYRVTGRGRTYFDQTAALNILRAGVAVREALNVTGCGARAPENIGVAEMLPKAVGI